MLTFIVCTNRTGYVVSYYPESERNKAIYDFHSIQEEGQVEVAALYDTNGEFINSYAKVRT